MSTNVRLNAEHLLNLVNMLPKQSDEDFWGQLDKAEHGDRADDGYFRGKMQSVEIMLRRELAGQLDPYPLAYLSQYILMFFDRDDSKMWELLDRTTNYSLGEKGRTGRRWAEDACRTAWALYSYGWGTERDECGPDQPDE